MNPILSILPIALVSLAGSAGAQTCLSTTFASTAGTNPGGGSLFDITVGPAAGITVTNIEVNANNGGVGGGTVDVDIYLTPGTWQGKAFDPSAWTLVSSGTGTSLSQDTPTPIDVTDFFIPNGAWGMGVFMSGEGPAWSFGGATQFMNSDITLDFGLGLGALFMPLGALGIVWNGTLCYSIGGGTTPFCTAKTTSVCGPALIGASGVSSVTATGGFTVSAAPTRGCRAGLLLYSNQPVVAGVSFGGPGDGLLCLTPTGLRRAGPIESGGTAPSVCDGVMAIDMNAFAAAMWTATGCAPPAGQTNPAGFLGNMGTMVNTQIWGRDSVSTGQVLSDGLSYTVGP